MVRVFRLMCDWCCFSMHSFSLLFILSNQTGAALSEFMWWLLEGRFSDKVGAPQVNEVELDEVLTGYRRLKDGFADLSFPTIAGVDGNGAIVHYRAERQTCSTVTSNSMVLIDSGGQYEEGTTDVTRTVHTGAPTEFQSECFTRVLKGHIALDSMVFPEDTPGCVLDVLARKALWEVGLDYGHGTGHGVGAALNVHEGPIGISTRYTNLNGLKAGMILSNEPGYYHQGEFGIRIENLLLIVEANFSRSKTLSGNKKFLRFEPLTLVPIQKRLLDVSLLTSFERRWIDDYHVKVREAIFPLLNHNPSAQRWLIEATDPIDDAMRSY
jgi:Xaa-Pro aminopeptidase